jgi:hypothetical protein
MGDVIDVDFKSRQDFSTRFDELMAETERLLEESKAASAELEARAEKRRYDEAWREFRQWRLEQDRRDLRRQLEQERAASRPSDDEIIGALRQIGSSAVATEVAQRLYRNQPSHSAVVRVGQALARLEAEGHVRRIATGWRYRSCGEQRYRWEPVPNSH